MILFPAIDLKNGACVRLKQGDMARATVFNTDPAAQARHFAKLGFVWLHVVDLNGAFAGRPVNAGAVETILAAARLPVQLGGGIRDLATIERWLAQGVSRIILGTAAVRDPQLVRTACRLFPGRIAVGIDARDGRVALEGWAEQSAQSALDFAQSLADSGVAAIIHTDIGRDGVLQGVNVEAMQRMAEVVAIPIIASGGVASLDDIRALRRVPGRGIAGAIIGRALYDGGLDAGAALQLAA
ncbi:MAG: 1-(5-phosphoribosyl)-5-[(5-phosphoribosylamino)methylideneamino]imidazole-4-carboxamide isomerase [Alphaproteobacteria bacterium]|nr:1-(5-phosphoribosyl)-5-[(5-phosphoribosylamino)methylideneamino]imidazole-4-carboxamide isomerase [Alphaproteobacteria bacterium]